MTKKIFVLDTSVCLTDSKSLTEFGTADVVIPLRVLEEIDKHKKRQDAVGSNARDTIRRLDEMRSRGSLTAGIRIQKGCGLLSVVSYDKKFDAHLNNLDSSVPDNEIIGTALMVRELNKDKKVVAVSNDINFRVKCDSINLETQDYQKDQVVKSHDQLYSGFESLIVPNDVVEASYKEEVWLEPEEEQVLFPNQFVMLVSEDDNKKTSILRFLGAGKPLKKLEDYSKTGVYKLKPRNKEQQMAFEILLDPTISFVTLGGPAGTGKTLLAVASALELLERPNSKFKKIVVSRPIVPMGKDIGFLPGLLTEKLRPWLGPIFDNLELLLDSKGTGKTKAKNLEYYFDTGMIEVEALTYIRGRSIPNAIIIIDEAQQLSQLESKTILTRVGEGTKLIYSSDISQIDNPYVNELSNGFTFAIEKLKHLDFTGHITLRKGERSKLATVASEIL